MSRKEQIKKEQSKKEQSKNIKKKEESNYKKKKYDHSESDDHDDGSDYSDSDELDLHEYRKFLAKIFPSKNINNKVKEGEKIKQKLLNNKKQIKQKEESEEEEESVSDNSKGHKKNKQKNYIITDSSSDSEYVPSSTEDDYEEEDDDEESEYETESSNEEDDNDDDTSEDEEEDNKKKVIPKSDKQKINLVLTVGELNDKSSKYNDSIYEYSYDYDESESESESETEDEDAPLSSDSESSANNTKTQKSSKIIKKNKHYKEQNYKDKLEDTKTQKDTKEKIEDIKQLEHIDKQDSEELLLKLKELYNNNSNNKAIQKCIQVCENDIKHEIMKNKKKEQKYKDRNVRIFKKIIKNKNEMNDYSFYEKLDIKKQNSIIKELKEINKITRIEKPYRISLLESNIPTSFKCAAMKKINSIRYMDPGSGEFYKIKNWVDTFMKIPFEKYNILPVNIDDGVEKCHAFMENAQKTLDNAVYGLNDAKMQIMQMLGQLITNPKAIGTAIAIHGPPGTGKTSLVKEGISKILNRPFAFIALGGATDSSFLEGHSYTYEGSTWGKIVQILIDSNCMNPVIYFDELDKISDTPRGDEIAGILTHLTDTSQNNQFHDKYFSEINFDLSKCLFIFSYNDESKVNSILKDRMYRIQTKGYNQKQKTFISNNYLLPKICEQIKFTNKEIIIPDESIHYIIDNYCDKEDGVRNLKRCLEIIHTKLNLYRLMKSDNNLFEEDMSLKVSFPFTVTIEIVNKLIKKDKLNMTTLYSMYI